MTTFNLRAPNNATFHWTRDLTAYAQVYNLAAATIRMQARLYPEAPDPAAYTWVTGASTGGVVTFSPTTNLAVFTAPASDMETMPADLVYDARLELANGATVPLFGGRLFFSPGVTRLSSDSALLTGTSGIGDTVLVDGECSSSPVPLPLSLSAVLAAVMSAGSGSITGSGSIFNVSVTDAFGAALGEIAATSGAGATVQITDSFGAILGYAA